MNKKTCLYVFLKLEVLKNFHDNSNNVLNYVVSGNLLNGKKLKVITRFSIVLVRMSYAIACFRLNFFLFLIKMS